VPQVRAAHASLYSNSSLSSSPRGHKRKHDEAREEEDDNKEEDEEEAREVSADESSKDSNEEGGGSSSEADEMAAALDLELNDFMWRGKWRDSEHRLQDEVSGGESYFSASGIGARAERTMNVLYRDDGVAV